MGKGGHDPYHPIAGAGAHQSQFHHEHDLDHYHPKHFCHKKLRTLKLSWRAKMFLTFEEPEYNYTARFVSFLLNACIFLSVIAFILSTMDQFKHTPHHCKPYMVVGHVCYGPHGEITQVVQSHDRPLLDGPHPEGALPVAPPTPEGGAADGGHAAPAPVAPEGGVEAAHHRFLQAQWNKQCRQDGQKWGLYQGFSGADDEAVEYFPKKRALAPAAAVHAPEEGHGAAVPAVEGGGDGHAAAEGGHDGGHGAGHDTSPGCHPVCEPEPIHAVEYVELFAMLFFTVDYLIRLLTVHAVPYRMLDSNGYHRRRAKGHYREPSGWSKTLHHFFHAMNVIDLLALAPFYFRTVVERFCPSLVESGILRVFRLLRVFRIAPFYMHMVVSTHGVVKSGDKPHFMHFDLTWFFDLLKIGDYAEGAPLIFWTIKSSFPAVAVAVLATLVLTVAMGTLMYLAEQGKFQVTADYPMGAFLVPTNYTSGPGSLMESPHANIFMSMFYIVSDTTTMQTIEMLVPHTTSGMSIDVIVDYVALMVLALPIAIVIRNFVEQYEERKRLSYFFKHFEDDEADEAFAFEFDEEDNDEEIVFGYLDEGNLQLPKGEEEEEEDDDDDIEMVAATAGRSGTAKADPSAAGDQQWAMVEKGEAPAVVDASSTQPPTPGPEEDGEEDGDGRRSRMDVKIQ